MSTPSTSRFSGELSPTEAGDLLGRDAPALLIDVRTRAELAFVGTPALERDERLALIEWRRYPDLAINPTFLEEARAAVEAAADGRAADADPLDVVLICRSGQRSLEAAMALAAAPSPTPIATWNLKGGFEGRLNADGRRGTVDGWKADGLPWRQS